MVQASLEREFGVRMFHRGVRHGGSRDQCPCKQAVWLRAPFAGEGNYILPSKFTHPSVGVARCRLLQKVGRCVSNRSSRKWLLSDYHRQASMFKLCLLQLEGAGIVAAGKTQGVKVAACTSQQDASTSVTKNSV